MYHAGFRAVPLPLRTMAGATYVEHVGHFWELSPWMSGEADFFREPSIDKLVSAANSLARFHQAASTFPGSPKPALPSPGLERRLVQLVGLQQGGARRIRRSLREGAWPEFSSRAATILDLFEVLADSMAAKLRHGCQLAVPLQPCIRDIWHEHVLYDGNQVSGFVDFGAMDCDSVAGDIGRLFGSLVGDNAAGWETAMTTYESQRPLCVNERALVGAFDQSAVLLSGMNWLSWVYIDRREFEAWDTIIERLDVTRARPALDRDLPFDVGERGRQVGALTDADIGGAVGQLRQHFDAAGEVLEPAFQGDVGKRSQRVAVDGVDEERVGDGVDRGGLAEGARTQRRPAPRLDQQGDDFVAGQVSRRLVPEGFEAADLRRIRLAGPLRVREIDHHGLQHPARTTVDADDAARAGRGVENARVLAVLEEDLAALDGFALLHLHGRLHARKVVRHDGDACHLGSTADDLNRLSDEREVETLLDLVSCHGLLDSLLTSLSATSEGAGNRSLGQAAIGTRHGCGDVLSRRAGDWSSGRRIWVLGSDSRGVVPKALPRPGGARDGAEIKVPLG